MEIENLEHSGILGMKWGIRRYQNADGSLTPAGKERYAKERSKLDSKYGITKKQGDYIKGRSAKAKREAEESKKKSKADDKDNKTDISTMSNDDIRKALERMDLEKKYLAAITPKQTEQAESYFLKYAKKFGTKLLDEAVNQGSTKLVNAILSAPEKAKKEENMKKIAEELSKLTDEDLKNKNNRKLMENNYKKLYYNM